MTSIALQNQTVSPRIPRTALDVIFVDWTETRRGAPGVEVGLSDGRTIELSWDDTHKYVGTRLHVADSDEFANLPLSTAQAMVPELVELAEQLVERAERWESEERATDSGYGSDL